MNISPVNLLNFKSSAQKNTRYSEPKGSNSTSPTYANASAEILRANYCPQLSSKGKGEDRLGYRSPEEAEEMLRTLEEPDYDDETTVGDLLEQRGYRSPEEAEEKLRTLKTAGCGNNTTVGDLLKQRGYRSPEEVEEKLRILKKLDYDDETTVGDLLERRGYRS